MVARTEQQIMERMMRIIMNHGRINRFELIEAANISISKYNQLKSFFEQKYEDRILYNKETKMWSAPDVIIEQEQNAEIEKHQTKLIE